ncbi:protein involved in ribonucleotide reduction [Actinobaculum suis]|uniref:Protein NrdI n=1 Tax=Actinobaculum suis TaxID=1657 RepID=A0A0K9ETU1_9ACTO|nr:class Ib ribonucleoside-diphosphate reductase assembly flavoprotein NrdI [Actinobaculum suis]KMY23287.1 ribonucleotide reductase stimulatory protein [Actinobaculum suis]MDY5152721.1 class Ib ribonucleoside-diphosphate reductase assembly flavoprotein NrdI [Actinobaculum suis]OCA95056.1 ribonucleotide reductase assembly protein NrdI [Actinobaculum suis]OCA95770.1 ribonucleotide reductase assembly protein NrdI [Actinobaculum suis]SDE08959.1 protein involved in ribonucleotide reduction [Actinob
MGLIVYFSSATGNTHRFVQKLGMPAVRIPIHTREEGIPHVDEPYVLITPTYGGGREKGAVPRPVIKFLNDPHNRSFIRGVIAGGNTNFGKYYCWAGDIIAAKCKVPFMYKFELLGTPTDVAVVQQGLQEFWEKQQ